MAIHSPGKRISPLAVDLRPTDLSEIIGQEHLLGPGKPLRNMADKRAFQSTILWGPPGTGKTTLIKCLAKCTDSRFYQLNATEASVKDIRKIIEEAESILPNRTLVFVDEIHRWNKSQQDTLLPHVECGTIVLFGATTEKPKFAVNSTILSRCLVLEVKPLSMNEMVAIIKRVKAYYKTRGRPVKIEQEAALRLINRASGDARKLITALETVIEVLSDDGVISVDHVDVAIPEKHLVFDASGNDHFDLAHCMQEAVQHSDADAAVYWLAKWLSSGEDVEYICRRIMIMAFEDAGDSILAITSATAAHHAAINTGLPECAIPMAHAVIACAQAGRSKIAYKAIQAAMQDVQNGETIHVPPGMRAGTSGYVGAITKRYVIGDLIKQGRLDDQ